MARSNLVGSHAQPKARLRPQCSGTVDSECASASAPLSHHAGALPSGEVPDLEALGKASALQTPQARGARAPHGASGKEGCAMLECTDDVVVPSGWMEPVSYLSLERPGVDEVSAAERLAQLDEISMWLPELHEAAWLA